MRRALLVVVAALFVPAVAGAGGFAVQPVGLTDGQQVVGVVHVEAAATAATQRVEFSIDGRLRAIADHAPFAFDWDTSVEENGPHVLELWAVAQDGSVASTRLTLVVANTFAVSLAAPVEGAQLAGTVHLAPQTAGLGTQWLDVLVDGELRWTLDHAPYGVDWNTALESPGRHTLTIRAVADGGAVAQLDVHVVVADGQTTTKRALLAQTLRYRAQTWSFESLMRTPRAPSGALRGTLAELVLWRSRASRARVRAAAPPHLGQWLCIHSHEASWIDHDSGNNGHYGGLQMSFDFMKGYGPELFAAKGTADHWTPVEQMWVSERAWQTRGFQPWPTTARMCGLL
jgi:Big-like domain-containing protein